MPRRITFPESALEFVRREMKNALPLFEQSFSAILNKNQTVSTYLPDDLVVCEAQLLKFRTSFLPLEDSVGFLDVDDPEGGAPQRSLIDELEAVVIELIRVYLSGNPRRLVIFNDPVPDVVRRDPQNYPLRIAYFGDALHYFVTAEDSQSDGRMIEPWDHARFIHWQAIGIFFDGFDHSISGTDVTLTEDMLVDLADHADALIVGAYDMESFIALGELPDIA